MIVRKTAASNVARKAAVREWEERHGKLVDDFLVTRAGRVVTVRNAPSPGATAALALVFARMGLVDKRRAGLAVSVLIILALITGVVLKIRQLERRTDYPTSQREGMP